MTYFFTVGKNPLPVAIAAIYLHRRSTSKGDDKFCLLCSKESGEEGKRIFDLLSKRGITCIEATQNGRLDAGNGKEIQKQVAKLANNFPKPFHFHYSGGTAAMAAHGMLAIRHLDPKAETSYIALHQNVLVGDDQPSNDLRREVDLTVDEVALLHGYHRCTKKSDGSEIITLTERLIPLVETWGEQATKQFGNAFQNSCRIRPPVKPDCQLSTKESELAKDLNRAFEQPLWNESRDHWVANLSTSSTEYWDCQNFFGKGGSWFELKVLSALRKALGKNVKWKPDVVFARHYARNEKVIEEKATFEIDIACVFGYQLVYISCSTEKADVTKEKSFEITSGARIILNL